MSITNSLGFNLWVKKSSESKILDVSDEFGLELGWKKRQDAFGKSDYDIPSRVSEFADEFMKLDQKVISSGKSLITIDIMPYSSGWKVYLFEKGLINEKKELLASAINLTNSYIFKKSLIMHEANLHYCKNIDKPVSYIINHEHSPLSLTKQQEICLFFLIRGKSAKEIAYTIGTSSRTVEKHISQLKEKLCCYSKSQLVEKAIDSGFMFYVPRDVAGI